MLRPPSKCKIINELWNTNQVTAVAIQLTTNKKNYYKAKNYD
jgi:hypothetical protein